jgi:hypothetical protein
LIPGFSNQLILFRWLHADYSKCTEGSSFLLSFKWGDVMFWVSLLDP